MTFRRTRCAHCRQHFQPERQSQIVHADCAADYVVAEREKSDRIEAKAALMQAKVERAQIKTRKEAVKTIPVLIAEAQKEFNAYIRERDKDKPCICCGRPLGAPDIGGGFDCGHYRSVGSASHLRFHEHNAHGQAKVCNRYGAGRAVDYRIGLVARIGREAVEALESDNAVHKWTHDELRAIKADFSARAKQLKKERA